MKSCLRSSSARHETLYFQTFSNYQLNAQFLYSSTMCMLHYDPQHVSSRTVCRWRADCSPLSTCILYGCLQRVTIPEAVVIQFVWGRVSPTETLFPILLLESVVNFSGRDVFSNEEFDHNALFHAPRYLLFAHHSSNSQTGLNRF